MILLHGGIDRNKGSPRYQVYLFICFNMEFGGPVVIFILPSDSYLFLNYKVLAHPLLTHPHIVPNMYESLM